MARLGKSALTAGGGAHARAMGVRAQLVMQQMHHNLGVGALGSVSQAVAKRCGAHVCIIKNFSAI